MSIPNNFNLAKVETVAGTDPTPGGGVNSMLVHPEPIYLPEAVAANREEPVTFIGGLMDGQTHSVPVTWAVYPVLVGLDRMDYRRMTCSVQYGNGASRDDHFFVAPMLEESEWTDKIGAVMAERNPDRLRTAVGA